MTTSPIRTERHGDILVIISNNPPVNALNERALDVFESEPLPADSPWLRMPNVLASPHLGYVEKDAYELYFGAAFQNVIDFANGTPKNVLNPISLK